MNLDRPRVFRDSLNCRAVAVAVASLTGAVLATPAITAQHSAPVAQAQDANESTGIAAAAAQDDAALARARDGWWTQALKTRDRRLAWFRDARFGAFLHWGPYSVLGGEWQRRPNPGYAEHIMRVARISRATYRDEVAARFHPDAFDARAWVRLFKAAGMRYVIITAKHHDGFAIWPSRASSYNIRDVSHFRRDPLAELVTTARAEGLRVGFYYSHAFDWESPDAPGNDWDYDNPGGSLGLHGGAGWWKTDPSFLANTRRYIAAKVVPQLKELVTRYHPDILWFDTPGKLPFFQQAEVVEAVRRMDPNVVINGRAAVSDAANLGDYRDTADRPAELRPTPGDWEAIPTTNESYGYNALDHSHKPAAHFVRLVASAAAKGGNILLNIGPRGDGTLDPPDVAILTGIGRWMARYGDSIHGTTRTPLDRQSWGDSTVKGNRLYLHVFDWPAAGELVVGGLAGTPVAVRDMASGRAIPVTRRGPDLVLATGAVAPDPIDSVIEVEMPGPIHAVPGRLIETRRGKNRLLAFDAQATGTGFTYGDGKTARYYVDGLEKPGNALTWAVRATVARTVQARVLYSTPDAKPIAGARFVLRYGGQTWTAPITPTVRPTDLTEVTLGDVPLQGGAEATPLVLSIEGGSRPVHVFAFKAGS